MHVGQSWQRARLRGGRGRLARLAGPLALLAVIIVWGTLAVVGWALLYWSSVPAGFVYAPGVAAGGTNRVVDALYISMVTMSTLGFGDIAPAAGWLRIATPLEALFGFSLLTVAVSWVLHTYPGCAMPTRFSSPQFRSDGRSTSSRCGLTRASTGRRTTSKPAIRTPRSR